MAFDAYMKIANIPGEAEDSKHSGWIQLDHFSHRVWQPTVATAGRGGGKTTGRVNVDEFQVTKRLDKASPKLSVACCKGENIPEVIIELCRQEGSGGKQKYMEFKLTDVVVASVTPTGNAGNDASMPEELVTLRFAKINWTYTPLDKSGKPQGVVAGGWDTSQHVAV